MNRHNLNFFASTRHWRPEELEAYLETAAGLLAAQEVEPDAKARAAMLDAAGGGLAPLVVWREDNLREEILGSIWAWRKHASARLLQAYQALATVLPIHALRIALRLLVDVEFRQGESLAFSVAAERWSDPDAAELRELGIVLVYLCGVEGGAGAAMAMAARLLSYGLAGSAFAEAAARVAANRTPSMLGDALDAVDERWRIDGVEVEETNAFLDDISLRTDRVTLAAAFHAMGADPNGPVLRGALRQFDRRDLPGSGFAAGPGVPVEPGKAQGQQTVIVLVQHLVTAQGRRLPTRAPLLENGFSGELGRQMLSNTRGNA